MSRHTDWPALDTDKHTFAPSAYKTYVFVQRHKSDKNIPVNLAKTATAALPFLCKLQYVQSKWPTSGDLCCQPHLGWLEKGITCSVKAARTARAKWNCLELTMQPQAPYTVEKLLQVYKVESCQQQRRFSSCKHLSLVSLVNSSFSTGRSSDTTE